MLAVETAELLVVGVTRTQPTQSSIHRAPEFVLETAELFEKRYALSQSRRKATSKRPRRESEDSPEIPYFLQRVKKTPMCLLQVCVKWRPQQLAHTGKRCTEPNRRNGMTRGSLQSPILRKRVEVCNAVSITFIGGSRHIHPGPTHATDGRRCG
jgi:hypothetical protein